MCVFLTGPDNLPVRLEFCCEQIHPLPNGGLRVWIDVLLQNINDQPLREIMVIYPHRYPSSAGLRPTAKTLDLTASLAEGTACQQNWLYLQTGLMDIIAPTDPADPGRLIIKIPDPDHPETPIEKSGTYSTGSVLKKGWASNQGRLKDTEIGVLFATENSFWRCEPGYDIGPKEARWFRWYFESPPPPANNRPLPRRLRCMIRGYDEFAHIVKSPNYLRDELYRNVHVLRVEQQQRQPPGWQAVVTACESLVHRLEACCVRDQTASLDINDMRLHVLPGKGRMQRILPYGLLTAGYQPDLLPAPVQNSRGRPQEPQEYYQWKTGKAHHSEETGFHVSFIWRRVYLEAAYLAWIGIALSLMGVIQQGDLRAGWTSLASAAASIVNLIRNLLK